MQKPPTLPNETERLATLKSFHILDTEREKGFDDINRLASVLCEVPIALISLVDANRQWFKACIGLAVDGTSRDVSFCAHAIANDGLFEIPDARLDARFADNPVVVGDPHIVFYAGMPLVAADGSQLGTLCVADRVPRQLNATQRLTLATLANQVVHQMEQREIARQLELTRKRLQNAFDYSPIGILELDRYMNIVAASPVFCAMLAYPLPELIGKNVCAITHPEDLLATRRAGQMDAPVLQRFEKRYLAKDGKIVAVNITTNRVTAGAEVSYFSCIEDVSQLRAAQLQLIQSRKMAALGEMAGGIAHEVNNPLAIICAAANQARRSLLAPVPDLDKAAGKLDMVEQTAFRIAKIIKGLRAFSRDSSSDPKQNTFVRDIIGDTLELCRERFRNHGIELRSTYSGDVSVMCRPAQIDQVLMNLLGNAFDAVVKREQPWVDIAVVPSPTQVSIVVTDSGTGIAPAIVEKLMLPFFTTKAVGEGTGLGLSISKGIAEDHDGTLYYEPASPNTRFILSLPLAPSKIQMVAA